MIFGDFQIPSHRRSAFAARAKKAIERKSPQEGREEGETATDGQARCASARVPVSRSKGKWSKIKIRLNSSGK